MEERLKAATIGWGLGKRSFPSGGASLLATIAFKAQLAVPSYLRNSPGRPAKGETGEVTSFFFV